MPCPLRRWHLGSTPGAQQEEAVCYLEHKTNVDEGGALGGTCAHSPKWQYALRCALGLGWLGWLGFVGLLRWVLLAFAGFSPTGFR